MSYWYWRTLKDLWTVDESTTNKFDLPERGHLSGLAIKLRETNETNIDTYDNPYPMQKTTIRIVGNGNVEIMDLRGRQLQAINFWESGEMPHDHLINWDANVVEQFAYIPFGRFLGDPKYGLILENFAAGVEFEETNTFDTTYYTNNSCVYRILGLFRKNPEPGLFDGGFFKKRQIKDKVCATESEFDVKLPVTNKLKQIHMFIEPALSSNLPVTVPYTQMSRVWLGIKSKEEYILNNERVEHFARVIHDWLGRKAATRVFGFGTGGDCKIDTQIYERNMSQITVCHSAGGFAYEKAATFWERIANVFTRSTAGALSQRTFYLDADGILYHGNLPLLMIDPLEADEEKYLDAEAMKDVYVSFTEGASTGHIYIVLDELQKTYPT